MRSPWILIGQSFPKTIRTIKDKIIPSKGGRNPCASPRGFAVGFGRLAVIGLSTLVSARGLKNEVYSCVERLFQLIRIAALLCSHVATLFRISFGVVGYSLVKPYIPVISDHLILSDH